VGKYKVLLGKYTNSAKVYRPIYIKKENDKKIKIGYARGGVYYTYGKSVVYINKANVLCKTNIISRKTDKLMECKGYTIAESFSASILALYNDAALKVVDVEKNTVTELIKEPCIKSAGYPLAILVDKEKVYYGKEKDGVSSLVQINIADKKTRETAIGEDGQILNIKKNGSDIYCTVVKADSKEAKSDANKTYKIVKTDANNFDQLQTVVENARLINVISNRVFYEYMPEEKGNCVAIKQYDIGQKKDATIIKAEDFPFSVMAYDAQKNGKKIELFVFSQSDESGSDKAVYKITDTNQAILTNMITSTGNIDILNHTLTVKPNSKRKIVGALEEYKGYNIQTVIIPNKVKKIPNNYFKGMSTVKRIYFPKTIKKINKQSLKGINAKATVYVEKSVLKKMKKMIGKINSKIKVRAKA
jgi:hypothetical protein